MGKFFANDNKESCEVVLGMGERAGFSNDGCGDEAAILPCGPHNEPTPKAPKAPNCYRISGEGDATYCKDIEAQGDGPDCFFASAGDRPGSCESQGYKFCSRTILGNFFASDKKESCEVVLGMGVRAGFSNDGCGDEAA